MSPLITPRALRVLLYFASPAIVSGALAWFELETTAVHEVATHTLVVGEVRWMGRGGAGGPLVRYESEYRRLES